VPAPVPYANLTNPQTLNLYASGEADSAKFQTHWYQNVGTGAKEEYKTVINWLHNPQEVLRSCMRADHDSQMCFQVSR
jgi:hypothetical protein